MNRSTPPDRWRWLLSRVLPARDRKMLLEELDWLYGKRLEEWGPGAANRWYREEVMAFVVRLPSRGGRGLRNRFGGWTMDGMRQAMQVVRGLRRAPGFAVLAVVTLAVGIGANALIFALADRALFRPLPYPESDQLVSVLDGWGSSLGSLEMLQEEMQTVSSIGGALDASGMTYEPEDGLARRLSVAQVSPEYLSALRVAPAFGRAFQPEESEPGRGQVALVSSRFHETMGGTGDILGQVITLEGERYEVVGVLPEGFDWPSARNDVWIPATMDAANVGYHWGMGAYTLVARMRPGVTKEQVLAELLRLQDGISAANPLWTPPSGFWDEGKVEQLHASRSQWVRTPLMILLGAVGVVLLVVCANVANLLLARGLTRRRDYAVRTALGAGSRQLAGVQMMEMGVLALVGGALGLAVARIGLSVLTPLLPDDLPGAAQIALDWRAVVFTLALALATSLLAGTLPALRVSGQSPGALLRGEGRGTASRSRRRTTRILVAAQMAAAVVLVVGSGLLARSLGALSDVDPGFQVEDRVVARLDVPPGLPEDREARALFFEQLRETLEADAALSQVALASTVPFGGEWENMAAFIDEVTEDPNNLPVVDQRRVSPNYFDVAGIPVLAGRAFTPQDRVGNPLVVIVDEVFANRFFPNEDPLGRIVRYPWRGAEAMEIVGVVASVSDVDLSADADPTVWFPMAQMTSGPMGHATAVAVSTAGRTRALDALQTRAREFDPRIAVSQMAGYDELLSGSMATPRLLAILLGLFAGTTLLLGCVGVYGVASFSVRERLREIGVRMTLGAEAGEIRRDVVREGLWLALPGGVVGLAVAAFGSRVLGGYIFGIPAVDPVTFAVTPLLLVITAVAAVYLPARRATRVDPVKVLRQD